MPGPRAGTCVPSEHEVYLIPSVTVPPTNTQKGQGVKIGYAQAMTTNQAENVKIAFQGDMRQDAASDPTLAIKITDLGSAPSSISSAEFKANVSSIIERGGNSIGTVFGILAQVAAARAGVGVGLGKDAVAAIPRFAIARSGYDQIPGGDDPDYVGITTNFARWPNDDTASTIPAHPSASGWTVIGQPKLLHTKDGKIQCWWIAKRTSDGKYDIIVYQFDPSVDTQFTYLAALNGTTTGDFFADKVNQAGIRTALSDVDLTIDPLGLAPVTLGDDIFCAVVATYGSYPGSKEGLVYSFRLSGSAVTQADPSGLKAAVVPDIWLNSATADFAGCDAVETNGRVDLMVSLLCSGFCSLTQSRAIGIMSTTDFKSWGSDGTPPSNDDYFLPTPELKSLGGFQQSFDSSKYGSVTRIARPKNSVTSKIRFACTNKGYILKSTDSGLTWVVQNSPVSPDKYTPTSGASGPLYSIHAASESIAWAVGASVVLKTSNGGDTWTFAKHSIAGNVLNTAPTLASSFPSGPWYGVWGKDANTAWICGYGGYILYTANGGTDWTTVISGSSTKSLNDIVLVASGTNTVLAVGESGFAGTGGGSSTRVTRAIEVRNATAAKSMTAASPDADVTLFSSGTTPFLGSTVSSTRVGEFAVLQLALNDALTKAYAIDYSGYIYRYTPSGASSPGTWTLYSGTGFGTGGGIAIDAVSDLLIFALTKNKDIASTTMWRSVLGSSLSTAWRQTIIDGSVDAISMSDADTGVTAGSTFYWAEGILPERCDPNMVVYPTGEVGMSCLNITDGAVEFWRKDSQSSPYRLMQKSLIQFTEPNGTTDPVITSARPMLTIDGYGDTLLYCQHDGTSDPKLRLVSPASTKGGSFTAGNSSNLGVPLGYADASLGISNAMLKRSSDLVGFSDGRLFLAASYTDASRIGVYVSRNFAQTTADNPTVNPPLLPGKFQWVGVDGVMMRFDGIPQIGDEWFIEPSYEFSTTNLVVETPSVYWLGPLASDSDAQVLIPELDLIWDRQAAEVVEQLGDGKYWDVTGVGLFGKNFRNFELGISNNGSTWTSISASETIASGVAVDPAGGSVTSVLYDSSKNWVPSEFKPGLRTHYLVLTGATPTVYKIVDNSRDCIMIENSAPLGTPLSYAIFSDTYMLTEDDWADSRTRFARYVRLRITAQRAIGNAFKIGTIILGNHVTYVPYTGNESRMRYSEGFGWNPVVFDATQQAENGITSVQHLGIQQQWTLNYEHAYWWDRDMVINGMLPRLRQAFAMKMDGSDERSAHLVRITGYNTAHSFADRYNAMIELSQVV